jgi:hypothetical protein
LVSPRPHLSLASTAGLVVTAPFGATTVSLRRDGLLQDGAVCAPRLSAAASAAWATEHAPTTSVAMTPTKVMS